jgi:flagellar biogenesis protein FliO
MHKSTQTALVVSHYLKFVLAIVGVGYYVLKKLKHKINSF